VEAVQRRSLLPSVENTGALSTKLAPPSLTIPSPSFTLLLNYCVSPLRHARFEIQRLYTRAKNTPKLCGVKKKKSKHDDQGAAS
jgi:hypothetical protein